MTAITPGDLRGNVEQVFLELTPIYAVMVDIAQLPPQATSQSASDGKLVSLQAVSSLPTSIPHHDGVVRPSPLGRPTARLLRSGTISKNDATGRTLLSVACIDSRASACVSRRLDLASTSFIGIKCDAS